jgi:hypothetical protein
LICTLIQTERWAKKREDEETNKTINFWHSSFYWWDTGERDMKQQEKSKHMILSKTINLTFLLFVIIGFIVIGCKKQEDKNVPRDNKPKQFYELLYDISHEEILGCKIPKSATNIRGYIDFTSSIWQGFFIARLSEKDFHFIVNKLSLDQEEDLLEKWPDAFNCRDVDFREKYWSVTNEINQYTYYYEYPHEMTRLLAKYEDGKLYFKRETKYINFADEGGNTVFKKELKISPSK